MLANSSLDSMSLVWATLACIACALDWAIGTADCIIALNKLSLPTVEADKPLRANICSTAATAGLAQVGISPLSIPFNKLSIWLDTNASSGRSPITPRSVSVKSIKRSSRASGSLPNSAIAASDTPALRSCFLALVTFDSVVPAACAATAFAWGLIVPVTLAANAPSFIFTSAPSIKRGASTWAAWAIASSLIVPVAASTVAPAPTNVGSTVAAVIGACVSAASEVPVVVVSIVTASATPATAFVPAPIVVAVSSAKGIGLPFSSKI